MTQIIMLLIILLFIMHSARAFYSFHRMICVIAQLVLMIFIDWLPMDTQICEAIQSITQSTTLSDWSDILVSPSSIGNRRKSTAFWLLLPRDIAQ